MKTVRYAIIDAIGPFFEGYQKPIINWSKIPFSHLESGDQLNPDRIHQVEKGMKQFCKRVAKIGYNAISLDDLAHLVEDDIYPAPLWHKIRQYKELYERLFAIARRQNLGVFINTDLMFYHPSIKKAFGYEHDAIIGFLKQLLIRLFETYPVEGIITRIGETDGIDVEGDFLSQLTIRTPKQARLFLEHLLPVFESYDRTWVFRTWTCGAYPIGDLIWNPDTYDETFGGIESDHLIVSMKYGDTDFYDHLDLNPLIFRGPQQKIVEFQARREREGFGDIPYYVGWQYQRYAAQLEDCRNCVGFSVWCQTGGWSRTSNLTFLKTSRIWNELNTVATYRILARGEDADTILSDIFKNDKMVDFVREIHHAFRKLLYIDGFSNDALYFRRLRIPPLLWLYWDHITINPLMIAFHHYAGGKPVTVSPRNISRIVRLGTELKIKQLDFYIDTLNLLFLCRQSLQSPTEISGLRKEIEQYEQKYPDTFHFSLQAPTPMRWWGRRLFEHFLRPHSAYRRIDRFWMHFMPSLIFRLYLRIRARDLPSFVNKQAMQLSTIFK
jgi:hypothetical protein